MYFLLSLLGGALYALGFPNKIIPENAILPIVGFTLLFYNYYKNSDSFKNCLLHSIVFSIGFNFTGFYWVAHTLQEFGELPIAVSWLLSSLFSFIILPQHSLGVVIYFLIKKKFKFNNLSIEFKTFLLAVFFTCLEQIIPQQFPAHIGHGWLAHKSMLGLAPIFGSVVYSFLSYLIALTLLSFYLKKKHIITVGIILSLLTSSANSLNLVKKKSHPLKVRVLQANIGNYLKLKSENGDMDSVEKVLSYYKKIAVTPIEGLKKIDLIIMPETAYPFAIDSKNIQEGLYPSPLLIQDITKSMNTNLLTGGYDINRTEEAGSINGEFNTAFLFNEKAMITQKYHKRVLIPFGETLPFGPLNKMLAPLAKNVSFFGRGSEFSIFNIKDSFFITPICYEILYSNFIRDYLNASIEKVNYIINLTNDSWYGDTAEPWQHKFLAHWRAVEFQIPIIRSTNTGITSVLYPDGTESKKLKIGELGALDVDVFSNQLETSTYQKLGYIMIMLLFFVYGLLILFSEPFLKKLMNSNKT